MKAKAKSADKRLDIDKPIKQQSDQSAPSSRRRRHHHHQDQSHAQLNNIQSDPSNHCKHQYQYQPGQQNMFNYVLVQNLNYDTNEETLLQAFNQYQIIGAEIFRNPNGISKGYAYVIFSQKQDAIKATQISNLILDGKEIKLQLIDIKTHIEEITHKKSTKKLLNRSKTETIFETKKNLPKIDLNKTNDLLVKQNDSINKIQDSIYSLNFNFQAFNTNVQALNANVQALNTNIQAVCTKFDTNFEQIKKKSAKFTRKLLLMIN